MVRLGVGVPANKSNLRFDYRLDVIRFICFLFVFICHFVNNGGNGITRSTNAWWNQELIQRFSNFGREGVTLFFVLSGFLLARILIFELNSSGKISIKRFLLRRIYRIWPLYFFFLFILFLINLFTINKGYKDIEIPYLLTFTYNWGLTFKELGGTVSSITWSLSIEEQIYLILPLVCLLKVKDRFLFGSIIFLAFGSISLLVCEVYSIDSLYLTTSYFVPLSFGMFLAVKENLFRVTLIKHKFLTIISCLFTLLYPLFLYKYIALNSEMVQFYLTPVYFVCLLHICDKFLRENILTVFLANLGRISYGCYLYHFIILFVFIRFNLFYSLKGFSTFGVLSALFSTCLISYISYHYFERFFLKKRLKHIS